MADLRITRTLTIPDAELTWSFSASGGPGGQHANTANTRADLAWSIEDSTVLGPVQRSRLLARFGPLLRISAADERSQIRNRELAEDRLAERVAGALKIAKPRIQPVKRPRHAQAAVRREKTRRSETKTSRRQARRPDHDA